MSDPRVDPGALPTKTGEGIEAGEASGAHVAPDGPPVNLKASGGVGNYGDPAALRGEIIKILLNKNQTQADRFSAVGNNVAAALYRTGKFFWHADLRDFASSMFFNRSTKCLAKLSSDAFQAWLSEFTGINRADRLFTFIKSELETASLLPEVSQSVTPENYWASRPGAVYLSCGDGQMVKITAAGPVIVDNGTDGVLFEVGRTLNPWRLVEPDDPFAACRLFRDISTDAGHARLLVELWIIALPTNPPCKPPLCLVGTVGSGKTRLVRGTTELLGLQEIIHKAAEGGERDFWPALNQGGLFCLDNADTRLRWVPDALATASTGGGAKQRRLYTNGETVMMHPHAWIAVTTAKPTFADDAGLADRLLVVRMERREGPTSDADLSAEIAAHRDTGLSFIAHTLARVLADTEPTPQGLNARHPDFAALAVRIGRAIGKESEAIAALRASEADKALFCLENDPLGTAIRDHLAKEGAIEGTAEELAKVLNGWAGDFASSSPKSLGKRLNSLWPHLASAYDAAKRPSHGGTLAYRIARKEQPPGTTQTTPSTTTPNQAIAA